MMLKAGVIALVLIQAAVYGACEQSPRAPRHLRHSGPDTAPEVQNWNGYILFMLPVTFVTFVMARKTRPKAHDILSPRFRTFLRIYLPAWYCAAAADWFQGPYVYALYAAYGYSPTQIAQLYVAGYASSMVCGAFVGSFADTWGRKQSCLLYCIMSIASCATKHYNEYTVLMCGRMAGGVATSILHSVFEAWMVSEHQSWMGPEHLQNQAVFDGQKSFVFSVMFFGNFLAAITCGVLAQLGAAVPLQELAVLSGFHVGGYTVPFDLAMVAATVCMFFVATGWKENYGANEGGGSIMSSLTEGLRAVTGNVPVALMGIVVCTFEGTMFCWVFKWTPALSSNADIPLPHGLAFAMFMMACMCGSSTFALLRRVASSDIIMLPVLVLATLAVAGVAVMMMIFTRIPTYSVFACFLVFEFCVGCYWPCCASLKSQVVPEKVRATVYNLYRVPLNLVVCGLLCANLSLQGTFLLFAALLTASTASLLLITKKKVAS